jgi:hypothetical protein
MKKISILLCSTLICFFSVNAQIKKKDVLLGGTFGFNSNNNNSGGAGSNTNINPRIGYAIADNSVLYLRLGAGFSSSKSSDNSEKYKSNNFNFGVSWQKLFQVKEKFGWYTDLYGQIFSGKSKHDIFGSSIKAETSSLMVGINPGLYFMATPRFKINADFGGFSYAYSKNKNSTQGTTNTSSNFNFNLLNYFGFGFDFVLNKKKS